MLLADAVRSETYRLSKSKAVWFWSVLFMPLLGVSLAIVGNLFLQANRSRFTAEDTPPEITAALAGGAMNIGDVLVSGASGLANPIALLFVMIGAATLYAGDYRWETWRLISARNTRTNLLLGKVGVFGLLALAAMILLLIGSVIENLIQASVLGREITFSFGGQEAAQMAAYFGLSWLSFVQFSLVGLLAATVSRSLLAALFAPLVIGVAQFFSPQLLRQMALDPDGWVGYLINPGAGVSAIKAQISGGPALEMMADGAILKGWASLIVWLVVPLVASLFWFQRQDLSKE